MLTGVTGTIVINFIIISLILTTTLNWKRIWVRIPHPNTNWFKIEGIRKPETLTILQIKGHERLNIKVNTGHATKETREIWGTALEEVSRAHEFPIIATNTMQKKRYFSVKLKHEELKENADKIKEIVNTTNQMIFQDLAIIKKRIKDTKF